METMPSASIDVFTQEIGNKPSNRELLNSTQKFFQKRHRDIFVHERFGQEVQFYSCNGGRNLNIGKAADNNIVIVDVSIDLFHCSIVHKSNDHYLRPSKALSGVWIKIQKRMVLEDDIIIELGFTQIHVDLEENMLCLRVLESLHSLGKGRYVFDSRISNTIKVGRSVKQELSFPMDSTMSSLHGRFTFVEGTWYYEDLETTNG
jgi:pSer/pThr/pTyr-binding forkhead associated (FHA) protein